MEGESRFYPRPGASQGSKRRETSEIVRYMRVRGQTRESKSPHGFHARAQILPCEYASLTEMCEFMGMELRENAPSARDSEEAGITQFLTHKSTLFSILDLSFIHHHFNTPPLNETDFQ